MGGGGRFHISLFESIQDCGLQNYMYMYMHYITFNRTKFCFRSNLTMSGCFELSIPDLLDCNLNK